MTRSFVHFRKPHWQKFGELTREGGLEVRIMLYNLNQGTALKAERKGQSWETRCGEWGKTMAESQVLDLIKTGIINQDREHRGESKFEIRMLAEWVQETCEKAAERCPTEWRKNGLELRRQLRLEFYTQKLGTPLKSFRESTAIEKRKESEGSIN